MLVQLHQRRVEHRRNQPTAAFSVTVRAGPEILGGGRCTSRGRRLVTAAAALRGQRR